MIGTRRRAADITWSNNRERSLQINGPDQGAGSAVFGDLWPCGSEAAGRRAWIDLAGRRQSDQSYRGPKMPVVLLAVNVGYGTTELLAALEPVSRIQFSTRLFSGSITEAPEPTSPRNECLTGRSRSRKAFAEKLSAGLQIARSGPEDGDCVVREVPQAGVQGEEPGTEPQGV